MSIQYEKMKLHLEQYSSDRALSLLSDEDFLAFCPLTAIELNMLYNYFLLKLK